MKKLVSVSSQTMASGPTSFNAFDFLLIVVVGFSMMIGFTRGLVRESLGLGAWIGAGLVAKQGYLWPRDLFGQWIKDPMILTLVGGLCVFCLALILLLCLSQAISYLIHKSIAHDIDCALGLIFGMIRGWVILVFFYVGTLFFILPVDQPPLIKTSKSLFFLNKSTILVAPYLPSALIQQNEFQKSLSQIQSML